MTTPKRDSLTPRQKLREWLREGDPLSEGLPEDEDVRRLRVQVLLHAQKTEEAPRGVPAFAAFFTGRLALHLATVGTLILAAVCVLWFDTSRSRSPVVMTTNQARETPKNQGPKTPNVRNQDPGTVERNGAPGTGMRDHGPVARTEDQGCFDSRLPGTLAQGRPGTGNQGTVTRTGDQGPGTRDSSAVDAASDRRPLQVQFTTPGGTRIVWVLNPDLALQPLQQED